MMTASRVKVDVQSESQSGPIPIKIWRNAGMGRLLIGNPGGRWVKSKSPVPVNFWVFPVDVPTLTIGAERYMLNIRASVEK